MVLMLPSGGLDAFATSGSQQDALTAFSHGGTNLVEMGAVSRHADEGMSWSSSACRVGNSFTTGTLVVMADGTTEAIESVGLGDEVLATDTETGSTAAREVEAVITGTGERTLVEITTTNGGAVVATDGHPIWEIRSQTWTDAVDLKPGDLLLDVDGGLVEVADVAITEQWATVHNLTVDVDHTYSVVVGNDAILTHNADPECLEQLRRFDPDAPGRPLSAPSSRVLGSNLDAAGITRPGSSAAHHIVAGSADAAAPARDALARFDIDINTADNGVFLPLNRNVPNPTGAAVHSTLHTNEYYRTVNNLLTSATNRAEALDALGYLRQRLLGGGL